MCVCVCVYVCMYVCVCRGEGSEGGGSEKGGGKGMDQAPLITVNKTVKIVERGWGLGGGGVRERETGEGGGRCLPWA